jgi:Sporulation and spore germination
MKHLKYLTFLAALFLTSCGTLEIGIERKPASTETANILPAVEATLTALPAFETSATATPIPPSPTVEILPPTETVPLPTDTQAALPPTAGEQMVKIYLIGIGDNGVSGELIGCGDSVIPVDVAIPPTKEVLRASLEKLLSIKSQFYGESGLYNSLYQSDLQIESISLDNGKAEIYLTGTMMLGGECDNPRVEAQLMSTVFQFSNIQVASIYINGKTLKDALSLK